MKNNLVIVSRSFAPLVIGSSVLLDNLLSNYPGKYQVIAGWAYDTKKDLNFLPRNETKYFKMPTLFLQRIFDKFAFYLVLFIKVFIEKHIRKFRPTAIMGVYPSAEYFVSSFKVAKKYRIPFIVHMHDLWEENISPDKSFKKKHAIKWEKIIFKEANIVYCMTSVQVKHYKKKYGINAELMPHTIQSKFLKNNIHFDAKKIHRKEKQIVYTGNVSNSMNTDALQQFVKSIDLLPSHYKIKMLTSIKQETIKKLKLYNERVEYDWLPMIEMKKEISKADLLFLPLSHKNADMEEVRTVFATKTLDYLVSGTPILVFSPKNSFHSISAKKNKWGYVVDVDDPKAISDSIIEVTNSNKISSDLVEHAYKEAIARNADDFSRALYENLPYRKR